MANPFLPLADPPQRIIVRMPNWLGDFVMAAPILTDLRHHWPEAKITALSQWMLSSVIQEDPHVDEWLNFQRPKGWADNFFHREIVQSLQKGRFDLGILLTNSFSSAFRFWQGSVQNRIGYAGNLRSPLLDRPIPFPKERERQHLVITYKMLLRPLGIPLSQTPPRLYLTQEEKREAYKSLSAFGIESSDILIGINPGAAFGSAKCWLPERFTELSLQLLEDRRIKIVFFGDKAGASLVQRICTSLPLSRAIDLAGKTTLRQLLAYIQSCDLFLTNDSGPMHAASALGIPLIALFGSTTDAATGPYSGGRVIHKHVPCSPCYRRECPIIDFRCMRAIEVKEVMDGIEQMVDSLDLGRNKERVEKVQSRAMDTNF